MAHAPRMASAGADGRARFTGASAYQIAEERRTEPGNRAPSMRHAERRRIVLRYCVVGGRRLEHLQYVASDRLFERFCGLARIPSSRTVANWLKSFTRQTVAALARLNLGIVLDQIAALGLRRATIDLDGTVLRMSSAVPSRHGHPASPRGARFGCRGRAGPGPSSVDDQ